jgi:hypothetical protein
MATLSLDTDPAIEKPPIEDLRQMPPWRKVALVSDMNRALRVPSPWHPQSSVPSRTSLRKRRTLQGWSEG